MNKYIIIVIQLTLIAIPILVFLKFAPPIIKMLILFFLGVVGIFVLIAMLWVGIIMLGFAIKEIFDL